MAAEDQEAEEEVEERVEEEVGVEEEVEMDPGKNWTRFFTLSVPKPELHEVHA